MSDNELSIAESAQVSLARKLRKYSYLLPQPSAVTLAKMDGGPPPQDETPSEQPAAPPPDPRLPPANWPQLTTLASRDRALGCLLGLAVGDAVGAAVEFKPRDSFPPVTDMTGGGPFDLKPGEWTDDTTQALCLGESLLTDSNVDLADFMTRMRAWMERGEYTVPGRCFDIGNATRAAIERYISTGLAGAGSEAGDTAGNASLVRLAPLAIRTANNVERARYLAVKQSRATHATVECLDACSLFVSYLVDALNGADKTAATRPRVLALAPNLLFISAGEWKTKTRDEIQSSGYVVHTLEAALWSVWQTDNFKDAVLTAANLGDDADSVAALAGQLAGALYGASAIPPDWLAKLAWRDKLEQLAQKLFDHNRKGRA
jgi:ADP-ribosylglycohydrolase